MQPRDLARMESGMAHENTSPKALEIEPGLDWLRGLAILLMIVNHAAFGFFTPDRQSGALPSVLILAGSVAPVLFFFATGWGVGLGAVRPVPTRRPLSEAALKCGWLVLADQLVAWANGSRLYFDFFSFIGLSYLALSVASRSVRWRRRLSLAVVAVLGVRYGLGPLVKGSLATPVWAGILTGTSQSPATSYPMMPWLSFPILGALYASLPRSIAKRWAIILPTGILAGIASYALAVRGRPLFRWGTMSLSYFFFSLAALATALALCFILSRLPPSRTLRRMMEVRGTTSFVAVPLHMLIIRFSAPLVRDLDWPDAPLAMLVVAVWTLTVPLARWLSGGLEALARDHAWLRGAGAKAAIAAATAAVAVGSFALFPPRAASAAYVGQVAVCLLMAASAPRKHTDAYSGPSR